MSDADLDLLLSRMERIAGAINAFKSEAVQHQAFSALMDAFAGRSITKTKDDAQRNDQEQPEIDQPNDPPLGGSVQKSKKKKEVPAITRDHVGTAFRLAGWKEPTSLGTGLSVAGSRKGTIDYSNPNNITTTPAGRNFVVNFTVAPEDVLKGIPRHIRDPLLEEFNKLGRNYRESRWEPAELNGGKF
eukprot:gene26647-32049_t